MTFSTNRILHLKADPKFKDGWAHVENINSAEGILIELNGMLNNDRHERLMERFDKQQVSYRLARIAIQEPNREVSVPN